MISRITGFLIRIIRNEITDEIDEKLDRIEGDINQILILNARHMHSVADGYRELTERVSRIEENCVKHREAIEDVLSTGKHSHSTN
jgi:hypothetical protein